MAMLSFATLQAKTASAPRRYERCGDRVTTALPEKSPTGSLGGRPPTGRWKAIAWPSVGVDGRRRRCERSTDRGSWRSAQRTRAIAPSRHAAASSAIALRTKRGKRNHHYAAQKRHTIPCGDEKTLLPRPRSSRTSREMNIAILGSRGFPSTYRGYDACARDLAPDWTQPGHTLAAARLRAIGLRLIKATQPARVEPGGDR